ncbi:MAG: MAE_28990/MAE_18760 family HEPN-like nuclease [Methylococcales bacterium]|nr:MAE_28990/MAE_18760 family HEPN-like nuclease [Methylococcales bacterium]
MNTALVLLEQEITSDIDTRLSSISSIKTLTSRYNLLDYDKDLLLQHSIPMIYSIWEGFIQQTFQIYIRTLNKLELSFDTLCKPMIIFHLENKFKQFAEYPKKLDKKLLFLNNLINFIMLKKLILTLL